MSMMAKTPSGYKKIGSVYLGERPVDKVFNANGDVVYALQRELTGVPPLLFKGKEQSELQNYRIYGDTVDGNSVGDLVESGEHAGEYKVPVTVKGKNLLNPNLTRFEYAINGASYFTSYEDGTVYLIPIKNNTAYTIKVYSSETMSVLRLGLYNKSSPISGGYVTNLQEVFQTTSPSLTIINTTYKYLVAQISSDYFNDHGLNNIMLNEGSTALPYEPYHAPITTPIYLPEPIKMVGDEAEYIDYGEQKQHRVRKNLFDGTIDVDNKIIIDMTGETAPNNKYAISEYIPVEPNMSYTYHFYHNIAENRAAYSITEYDRNKNLIQPMTLHDITEKRDYVVIFTTHSDTAYIRINWKKPYDEDVMLNEGSTALPYEPYIENTEVDVTLPALPTIKGTNVLSVGTEVQPSRMDIEGRIESLT